MRTLAFAFAVTLVPTLAVAQPQVRQDRREVRQDQREVHQDQRAAADDRRDAQRFSILLSNFDEAVASRQPGRLVDVDRRVLSAIDGEIRESNREVAQKGNEAARSEMSRHQSGYRESSSPH